MQSIEFDSAILRPRRSFIDSVTLETIRDYSQFVIRSLNLLGWTMPTSAKRGRGAVFNCRKAGSAISEILLIRRIDAASRYWNSYDELSMLFPFAIDTCRFILSIRLDYVLDTTVNEKKIKIILRAQKQK